MLLAGALGLGNFYLKIYVIFIALLCLYLTAVLYSAMFKPALDVTSYPPERSTCGHRVSFGVHLHNRSKKEYFDLFVREINLPPEIRDCTKGEGYIPILRGGEDAVAGICLEFKKRGHYVLPGVLVETSFPFGIWKAQKLFPRPGSLLVYPHFHPLLSLNIPVGLRYHPGGIALTSYLGDSLEFISTREFRSGDSPRMIHWRSWARVGKPIVRECQEEYYCRIALLLDTYVPDGSKKSKFDCLESAISLSAAIADNLSRQEYIIDIFAAGPNLYHLQAGRSLAYLENILDILACLNHCPAPPFDRLEPLLLENLSQITTCIMVFLDWDGTRENLARTAARLGTSVKIIIVRDEPPSMDPAFSEDLFGKITIISSGEERMGVEHL